MVDLYKLPSDENTTEAPSPIPQFWYNMFNFNNSTPWLYFTKATFDSKVLSAIEHSRNVIKYSNGRQKRFSARNDKSLFKQLDN